ncbi:beta-lactamase family protein [Lachnospiraceae bacterium MD1]|uniref:Beta-lactamase family protein n=1 Tax=Variimorphobacter saccharofermentans TaxID=2755051 RepID=A0A839JVV9_9FIRM|nr:serine hydrolase domain-containing protein [Variimorphobacter saccharofermentans]MBB2181358.1 beta-lactamase family protein [Variimorphobacter saccharofermentans]
MNKKIKRLIYVFPIIFSMLFPSTALASSVTTSDMSQMVTTTPSKSTDYTTASDLAKAKAEALLSMYGATSVQYALIDHGKIVLSGQAGVYSMESGKSPAKDTLYGIGSISKVFTATAVMQLVDEGKINLDTPVYKYLPEFQMADSRYKAITVRMLLNHSSGLMGSTYANSFSFAEKSNSCFDYLLKYLKTSRLKADPGMFSVYCNDGFTLAELLVEKISGISFTQYIKDNISTPLTMKNTFTPNNDFSRSRLAKGYFPGIQYTLPTEAINIIGTGGIYSTAEDMCQFATTFMSNSTPILSTEAVNAMANPEYRSGLWAEGPSSILSYGLGWDSVDTYPFTEYGIKALVKGGDTLQYHGSLVVLPEENMAMTVLSSGGSSTLNQLLAQEVLLSVLQEKGSISEIHENVTFQEPVMISVPDALAKYNGFYANRDEVVSITINPEGTLTMKDILSPEDLLTFIHTGDGKFYAPDGSYYLSFSELYNGYTYIKVSGYSEAPGLGQVVQSEYQYQKLEANPLSNQVKTAWQKRNNKNYFMVDEAYTSELYAIYLPALKISLSDELEGYYLDAKITGKNSAKTVLQIPAMNGRDLVDYQFYIKDNKEYLEAGGTHYISEDAISTFSTKSSFTCKINKSGEANWYKIGKKSEGKKIQVTVPKNSSFSVYDENGACIHNSLVFKSNTVTLPKDGYIVFVGNANAKFKVSYTK